MVERIAKWGMAWTALIGVIGLSWFAVAATTNMSDRESLNRTRACDFEAGSGWTEIDCSAAAAYSAVLTHYTRYVVQATGGNPYLAITTAGSGQDADSSDGYLKEGEWLILSTPNADRYISCDGSADSSKLVYLECK